MSMNPRLTRFSGRSSVQGAATEIILDTSGAAMTGGSSRVTKVEIVRCKIKRVSGTAINFTPMINDATGSASGSIDQVLLGTATPVATLFDPVINNAFAYTNIIGHLFLVCQPNAGADNVFDYEVFLKVWL
jgi:hypothetical protein